MCICVSNSIPANIRLHRKVKMLEIRAVGQPDFLKPEFDPFVEQPLLGQPGHLAGGTKFAAALSSLPTHFSLNPWLQNGLQDVYVLHRAQSLVDRKRATQQLFSVGLHEAKRHCAKWMRCCKLVPDVVMDLLGLLGAHVFFQTAVGLQDDFKNFFVR
jgi:hypothetical protein